MPYRTERDSMGETEVPVSALYGAQTQRAIDNFPVSRLRLPREFIQAVALIKQAAAFVNGELGLLENNIATAIQAAAIAIRNGEFDDQFPIDVYQTGSGTSTNMNVNEVLASLASRESRLDIHPNDHVNMGQSSNDVIPTALHLSAAIAVDQKLLPALKYLESTIKKKAQGVSKITKTGRTHLMDAMPLTLTQEMSGWATQIGFGIDRIESVRPRLHALAQGGTAVGTGVNTHPEFAPRINEKLSELTGLAFKPTANFFESISSQDTAVELSGQLKVIAVGLMKISNDLRWMNSGPLAGLSEIKLEPLQPGSSIMPGKVNPVVPEATAMVAAQVMGNDTVITIAGQSGNFQLNVMLPVIAYNLLQSIEILSNAVRLLADKSISSFIINQENIEKALKRNPILVTALNPIIGYTKAAEIAKAAYENNRAIIDVAEEMTDLTREELERLLDPWKLTMAD